MYIYLKAVYVNSSGAYPVSKFVAQMYFTHTTLQRYVSKIMFAPL